MHSFYELVRFEDRWSYIYFEHGCLGRKNNSLIFCQKEKNTPVPIAVFTNILLGPGTTTKAITNALSQEKTVLGVDLLINKQIVASDLNEQQIINYIEGAIQQGCTHGSTIIERQTANPSHQTRRLPDEGRTG